MKKTVLVTGGAGFIGSNFVYLLLEERPEWKVVCVDALTYAANIHTLNDALKNQNFVFYKEDIRNREGIFSIFEKEHPDIVVKNKNRSPLACDGNYHLQAGGLFCCLPMV